MPSRARSAARISRSRSSGSSGSATRRSRETARPGRHRAEPFQRVGLSATQRPMEEIGRFVSGAREIELVDAGTAKELELQVVMPLEDMREPEQTSIWPSIYPE